MTTSQRGGDGEWRKSSLSGENNDCVEVCFANSIVRVRDSKDRGGHVLHFTDPEWRAFLTAIRSGEFDT